MKYEPFFRVLTEIIEGICRDHLNETRIFTEQRKGVPTLVVFPHAADYPKLIGRNGAQVNAFNFLVQRVSLRLDLRLALSIRESFIGEREPIDPFCYNPEFDLPAFEKLLTRLAAEVSEAPLAFTVTTADQMVIARYPCERGDPNAALGSALAAVLRPYCRDLGRSIYIKPQFLNQTHETDPELLRQR